LSEWWWICDVSECKVETLTSEWGNALGAHLSVLAPNQFLTVQSVKVYILLFFSFNYLFRWLFHSSPRVLMRCPTFCFLLPYYIIMFKKCLKQKNIINLTLTNRVEEDGIEKWKKKLTNSKLSISLKFSIFLVDPTKNKNNICPFYKRDSILSILSCIVKKKCKQCLVISKQKFTEDYTLLYNVFTIIILVVNRRVFWSQVERGRSF